MITRKKKTSAATPAKPASAAQKTSKKDKKKQKASKSGRSFTARVFGLLFKIAFVCVIIVAAVGGAFYYQVSRDLPHIGSLKDYKPPIISTIYDDKGEIIGEFFKEKRILTRIEDIPLMLSNAFVAAEDGDFYEHPGYNLKSIARAFLKNARDGEISQGGSTITQQVVKGLLLTPERTYTRKAKEILLAMQLEETFTKEEILYMYLNQIFLGHGAYGVEAAAQNYYGKTVTELNLAECAMLAGLPQAPSSYSPFRHFDKAKARQVYVLGQMVKRGFISAEQEQIALNTEIKILPPQQNAYTQKVPFYTEYVRQYIMNKYGEDALYKEGLKIYAAVNIDMQLKAEAALKKSMMELDGRHTFRGPLQKLNSEAAYQNMYERIEVAVERNPLAKDRTIKAIVVSADDTAKTVLVQIGPEKGLIKLGEVEWDKTLTKQPTKSFEPNDVIMVRVLADEKVNGIWPVTLERYSAAQAALICMENETGLVKALVGGRDFADSQFNRATQSRRQPGSSFKPILYAAALDYVDNRGQQPYAPSTILLDSAIVYSDSGSGPTWKPKNYDGAGKFYGMISMREALAKSRNLVSVRIIQDIGPQYTVDYAKKLGITSELGPYLSLALGSSGLSLLELTHAYSVFANQGKDLKPIFVITILDRDGKILEDNVNYEPQQAISPATAYMMTSMMTSVVREGTAARAKAINRPAAGKTGTTNDLMDAWFVGYTPQYITGVWMGFDELRPLGAGETGSRAPLPLWTEFMKEIHEGLPVKEFPVPKDITFARVDAETGLLPIPESKKVLTECFRVGQVPKQYTKRPGDVETDEDFYKNMF